MNPTYQGRIAPGRVAGPKQESFEDKGNTRNGAYIIPQTSEIVSAVVLGAFAALPCGSAAREREWLVRGIRVTELLREASSVSSGGTHGRLLLPPRNGGDDPLVRLCNVSLLRPQVPLKA